MRLVTIARALLGESLIRLGFRLLGFTPDNAESYMADEDGGGYAGVELSARAREMRAQGAKSYKPEATVEASQPSGGLADRAKRARERAVN